MANTRRAQTAERDMTEQELLVQILRQVRSIAWLLQTVAVVGGIALVLVVVAAIGSSS